MNNTIALIINLPTLFLLYIIIYFTQSLSGKRQFYGVSLNSDYFTKEEFKSIDKKFKLLVTLGFIIFSVILLIFIYVFKAYVIASILPVLGFCIYEFLIYIYIHNKVKYLKKTLSLEFKDLELEKTKLILDTDFINEKNKIIKKYSILFIIPIVITLLVSIYVATRYHSMPDIIPTHWTVNGEADAFSKKSILSVFGSTFMGAVVSIIIYISSVYSLKSRAKLNSDNISESKLANLNYLNKLAITFLILNINCQILFISILIAILNAGNINTTIMWSATIALIISAIYQTYLYYKSPSKSKTAVYSVDDDDNNWILGTFYNNPEDPSLFVQKRFGVGWTINIGTTMGKFMFISPVIILILVLIISFYL